MKRPICCDNPAKEYRKLYYWPSGIPHSIEQGFRCLVCGALRLPFGSDEEGYKRKREEDEQVYQDGLKFDAELAGSTSAFSTN